MRNLLLDTNIVLGIIRAKNFRDAIQFINPENALTYLSIVSEAEVKSFALRKNWGINRLNAFNEYLDEINIVEVNRHSLNIYAQIDAYSQRLNPDFENYPFNTPRNMGKNDLWIASLAALLGLRLVTTYADFDHLHNVFFEVQRIKPMEFVPFF